MKVSFWTPFFINAQISLLINVPIHASETWLPYFPNHTLQISKVLG